MTKAIRVESPDGRAVRIERTHSDVTVKMRWNPFRVREGEEECLMARIEAALEDHETRIIQGVGWDGQKGEWVIVIDTSLCARWDSWEVSETVRHAFTGGDA